MLISIPTDTSTIFGAFQAILALPLIPDELAGAEAFHGEVQGSRKGVQPASKPDRSAK
jgi:hypothetical protein